MSSEMVMIDWPKKDVRAMWSQIARAQSSLDMDLPSALRFAAWSVARSLGVMTKEAKRYRPYKSVAQRGKMKRFEVISHKRGQANKFSVMARSVAELKKTPQVKIGQAGRAKASWMWGIRKIGRVDGGGGNISYRGTPSAVSRARNDIDVTQKLRGVDRFIRITNRLPYIQDALKGGSSTINQAIGKASRSMARIISENIKKKMGAK